MKHEVAGFSDDNRVLWFQNEDKNGARKNGERKKDGLEERVRVRNVCIIFLKLYYEKHGER